MNTNNKNSQDQDLRQILFDGLNEHGFIFQEKCAEVLRKNASGTKWKVVETEYPVDSNDKSTRIDIVLSDTTDYSPNRHQVFAIVECKRVNPTRGWWLFGKPVDTLNKQAIILWLQSVNSSKGNVPKESTLMGDYAISWSKHKCNFDIISPLVNNWWLQIAEKSSKKRPDSTPQPVEDSFMQACVGVSGMAQESYRNFHKNPRECSVFFIPVVITTEPLYYAEYNLSDVDLTTGYIGKDKVFFGKRNEKAEELKWVQVNYPATSSIFSEDFSISSKTNFLSGLREDYQSSIYVVNSNNIPEFFSRLHLG